MDLHFGNVSPSVYRKGDQCLQVSGKEEAAAKVLLTMVPKVRILDYAYKLVGFFFFDCHTKIFTNF